MKMSEQATEDNEEQTTTQQQDDEKPTSDAQETKAEQTEDEQTEAREQTKKENEGMSTTESSKRQKQLVAEFNRLKASLEREATKIIKPDFKQYSPYIHTSLAPYYNTYTVQFLLSLPPHVRHGYITRKTAIGLVDPEVSHSMDIDIDEVPESVPIPVTSMDPELSPRSQGLKAGKEGSTRLPKWPVVKFRKTEDSNKKLNWGDVPRLRETLKTQYSSNAQERVKNDYQRTKEDWERMELDKLRDIQEVNRSHMRITCGTYLGTSQGSHKAVKNLTKILE